MGGKRERGAWIKSPLEYFLRGGDGARRFLKEKNGENEGNVGFLQPCQIFFWFFAFKATVASAVVNKFRDKVGGETVITLSNESVPG